MTGQKIGYTRVSTGDQHPEAQEDALRAAGCAKVFTDHGVSGKLARRPQLDAALAYLREGDTLVITKLDRLGRSVRNLIDQVADLGQRGVDLVVLHQGIDTTTPGGKLLFHVMAAVAEFERDLGVERTRDGLQAARARGRTGGRKPKLSSQQMAVVRSMYESREHTIKEIADVFKVSEMTIYRALRADAEVKA